MSYRKSVRLAALAASVAGLLVVSGLTAPVASADETGSYLVSNTINASDPYAIQCNDAATGFYGTCLYTSSDLGSGNTADNPYPMNQTRLFTLASGLDPGVQSNWVPRGPGGVVFNESQITTNQPGGFVPAGANHLWAPAAAYGPDGNMYLYVPDVSDKSSTGVHTSSHIAVASSASPFGPFSYIKQMSIPGYASDPEVLPATVTETVPYLVWANGDGNNCGGLSIASLNGTTMADLTSTPQEIQINGIGVLGNCGGKGRPYLEGPSLYGLPFTTGLAGVPGPYTLVFAAKPTSVPVECRQFGQPNTANEVLAYATSTSGPTGPYTYKGLLMCGSSSDWTNQATIVPLTDNIGVKRLIMIHHDGPSGTPKRKLHAECLYYGNGWFGTATRTSTGSIHDCIVHGDLEGPIVAFRSTQNGKIVTAESAGASSLRANRYIVGPWERFQIFNENPGYIAISSDIARKWVNVVVGGSADYLETKASSPGTGDGQSAAFQPVYANGGATIGLVSAWLHRAVVMTGPDGELRADNPAANPLYFDILHH
jgi:hypothetical protein